MEGQLIGHSIGHRLRVGSGTRAAAEDAVMDGRQFVRHAIGHVGAAGRNRAVVMATAP